MTTLITVLASDIISDAFQLAQIWDPGEENDGVEANIGLRKLSYILATWSIMPTLIPAYNTVPVSLIQGDSKKTVSPPIADILESSITDQNGQLYPLTEINLQEFNTLNFNNQQGTPRRIYAEENLSNQDVTNLYFYPPADRSYTVTLYLKQVLTQLAYSDPVTLPAYFLEPLTYELAKKMSHWAKTTLANDFYEEYKNLIDDLKARNRTDMSVQNSNPFNTWRRFRPWNMYAG